MRILLVSQDFPPATGGIQTYVYELARHLARQCEYVGVLTADHAGARAFDESTGFPVYRIRIRPDLLGLRAFSLIPPLARKNRIDVAFHAQWPTVPASSVSRFLSGYPRKIAVAAHGRELLINPASFRPLASLYDSMRKSALSRADRAFPVSRYTADLLHRLGVSPPRTTILNNGVDPERFRPHDSRDLQAELEISDRRILLTLARLVPRKGIDITLRALAEVIQEIPDVVYLICGNGPDRPRLQQIVSDLDLHRYVRFIGWIREEAVPHYFNLCDIFVMPASNEPPDVEGFGLVFLEANACGKPVIGASSGGIPDAVRHGETGLLVPPGDERKLADALLRLLRDENFARRLGQNGRSRVLSESTWELVTDRLCTMLR